MTFHPTQDELEARLAQYPPRWETCKFCGKTFDAQVRQIGVFVVHSCKIIGLLRDYKEEG